MSTRMKKIDFIRCIQFLIVGALVLLLFLRQGANLGSHGEWSSPFGLWAGGRLTALDRPIVEGKESALVINPHPFTFLIKSNVCLNEQPGYQLGLLPKPVRYFFVVHSSAKNYLRRMVIRDTYGSQDMQKKFNMTILFVTGMVEKTEVMRSVNWEGGEYGDLILESFSDTYRNLTYKAISWLKYLSLFNCPDSDYVVKVDDDTFVNLFHLMDTIQDAEDHKLINEHSIMCYAYRANGMKVIRDRRSKWYVAREDYPYDRFSTYCSGAAYIIARPMISPMFIRSFGTKYISIDDYYVTGALPLHIQGANWRNIKEKYLMHYRIKEDKVLLGDFIFINSFSNRVTVAQRIRWWKALLVKNANETTRQRSGQLREARLLV